MRKEQHAKCFSAAVAAVMAISQLGLFPVNAVEYAFGTSEKQAVITIEQLTVTMSELQEDGYKIPVVIEVTPNPGFTTLEFGISSELSYQVVNADDEDKLAEMGAKRTAVQLDPEKTYDEIRWLDLIHNDTVLEDSNFTWFTYASNKVTKNDPKYLAVLEVTVPENVKPGDTFPITYRSSGIGGYSNAIFANYADTPRVEYHEINELAGIDGYIRIAEEPGMTTTTLPETTTTVPETTTTLPETTTTTLPETTTTTLPETTTTTLPETTTTTLPETTTTTLPETTTTTLPETTTTTAVPETTTLPETTTTTTTMATTTTTTTTMATTTTTTVMTTTTLPETTTTVTETTPVQTAGKVEHKMPVSAQQAAVMIEQLEVPIDVLRADDYTVPVMVQIRSTKGINALEFGVRSQLEYRLLTASEEADLEALSRKQSAFRTVDDSGAVKTLSSMFRTDYASRTIQNEGKYISWLTFSSANGIVDDPWNFAVLEVKIPATAAAGDTFPIEFCDKGLSGNPVICGLHDYMKNEALDYVASNMFEGLNGYVRITAAQNPEEASSTTTQETSATTTTETTTTPAETTTETNTTPSGEQTGTVPLALPQPSVNLRIDEAYVIPLTEPGLSFKSFNPDVASVSEDGTVTAKTSGQAQIVISDTAQHTNILSVNVVAEGTEPYLFGDCNGDGVINARDATLILRSATKIGTNKLHGLTNAQYTASDVNQDKELNARDANVILRYATAVGAGRDVKITDFVN